MRLLVLLFLICLSAWPISVANALSEQDKRVYADIMALRQTPIVWQLKQRKDADAGFLLAFKDALYLIFTEDYSQYEVHLARIEQQIDLQNMRKNTSEKAFFCYTELLTLSALVKLRFENKLAAIWALRKAFQELEVFRQKYPKSHLPLKNLGALNILTASTPARYQWALKLIGLQGNNKKGLAMLDSAALGADPRALQAALYKALIKTYMTKNNAANEVEKLMKAYPEHIPVLFAAGVVALKNKQTDKAQQLFLKLILNADRIPYAHYLLAETYLYGLETQKAKVHYTLFLKMYKGKNYRKDAHFKFFLALYLENPVLSLSERNSHAQLINSSGLQATEQDQYAAKVGVNLVNFSANSLIKARLLYDGGYYSRALILLNSTETTQWAASSPQMVEFYYRKGLIFLNTGQTEEARSELERAYLLGKELPHFYAANAALQLGVICQNHYKDREKAIFYWQAVLNTPEHEYKNTLDDKATQYLKQIAKQK